MVNNPPPSVDQLHEEAMSQILAVSLGFGSVVALGGGYLLGRFISKVYGKREQDETVRADPVANSHVTGTSSSTTTPAPLTSVADAPVMSVGTSDATASSTPLAAPREPVVPSYAKFQRRKAASTKAPETSTTAEAVTQMFPRSSKMTPEKLRSASKLGRNSFLIATLLAGGTVAAGTYAMCSYHDVWTARAFALRMRAIFSLVQPGEKVQQLHAAGRSSWMNGFLQQWVKMPDASQEPDPEKASKVLGWIDVIAKTEIDLCDVFPFLGYLPAVKRARENKEFMERYTQQHTDVLNILQQLNDEYLSEEATPVSIPTQPVDVAPASNGWGQWAWNGVTAPYYWVTGK